MKHEPPTVTPRGNLLDQLAHVCPVRPGARLTLDEYFQIFKRRARIWGFSDPRTRAAARAFLRRWNSRIRVVGVRALVFK